MNEVTDPLLLQALGAREVPGNLKAVTDPMLLKALGGGDPAAGIEVKLGAPERPAIRDYEPTPAEFAADDAAIAARKAGPPIDTSLGARAQRFGAGVVRGLRDPVDALVQMYERTLPDKVTQSIAGMGTDLAQAGLPGMAPGTAQDSVTAAERDYQQGRQGIGGLDAGRLTGNIAATLPAAAAFAPTVLGGAAAGALTGALQPVDTEADPNFLLAKAKQAGLGLATGAAGAGVTNSIAKAVSGAAPSTRQLVAEGVRPTPGQVMGGAAQRIEEGATSIPILGDVIKSAQRRGTESFNRAALNKALAPIGEKLNPKTMIGHEAVAEAGEKISQAYQGLLPRLTATVDEKFAGDMGELRALAKNLPEARFKQFQNIISEKLLSKINPQTGMMTGEGLKEAESELGKLARTYGGSQDGDQRLLGDALRQAQANLRDLVERSNPAEAGRLKAINSAYAMQLRMENAAGRLGSKEGVFSPAALKGAVRQMDKSLNKRQFARGNALLQDFAENAEGVLGPRVPDSGTPFRFMAAGLPALAGYANPYAGAAAGGALLGYTPWGQRLMAHVLASRPQGADAVAQGIRSLAPFAGAEAPILQGLLKPGP